MMNVVGSKWVLKIKLKSDGSKTRLEVKGCSQKEGIGYDEAFSRVVKTYYHLNYFKPCYS